MVRPSGENTGSKTSPVRIPRTGPPPPGATVQSPGSPAADTTNAMWRPSGDHDGEPCAPIGRPVAVNARARLPSRSVTQMTDGMFALYANGATSVQGSDWNARCRPSGDQAGRDPNSLIFRGAPPSAGTTQMPPSRRE